MPPEGIEAIIAALDWTADLSNAVVVVLYAYFDDSGTDAASPVAVMAGYVAHMADWKRFEIKTKQLYEREGIPFFRAKLFDHGQRQFRGWTDGRRLRFATDWCAIASRYLMRGVSTGIYKPDFDASKAMDKKAPQMTPQTYALQLAISSLCRDEEVWNKIERYKLHVVVESSTTSNAGMEEDFNRIVGIHGLGDRLASITFANKSDSRALHMADYLAYYSHRFALTALHDSIEGRTPYLQLAQDSVKTIMKLAEQFKPNPEFRPALARWRASLKKKLS